MRNLILAAAILHAVILIAGINGFQFGDIISFKRGCPCVPLYKHFAVYLGNDYDGGKHDIFHHTGNLTWQECKLDLLKNEKGTPEKDNYLEVRLGLTKLSKEDIKKHIEAVLMCCGKYSISKNNCEHLATYVRYGKSFSWQPGTIAGLFYSKDERPHPEWEEALEKLEEKMGKDCDCNITTPAG